MTVRPVLTYPSRVLKGLCGPVGAIGPRERQLATDLIDTMYNAPGCVGVAAPQLGVPSRAFAMDVSVMKKPPEGHHGLVVLFDPEVLHADGSNRAREGCLSVPDFTCDVRRADTVVVRGVTPDGQIAVLETTGFEARALQHELDHLDGRLILDRVAARSDVFPRKRYAKPGEHLK